MNKLGTEFVRNTKINIFTLLGILTLIAIACRQSEKNGKTPVLRVYDRVLYAEDIPPSVYQNAPDSARAVKAYINGWLRNSVFSEYAEQNVDTAYVNRLIQQYREDLLRDLYEEKLKNKLRNKVEVTEEELSDFYENRKKNFPARDTLVKWRYLVIDAKDKDRHKITSLFFSADPKAQQKLETHFAKFLAYKTDTLGWITYAEARKIIPGLPVPRQSNFRYTQSKKNRLYLVQIKKVIYPGQTVPFEYIKNRLKTFVIEKKLQKEIRKMKNEMLDEAYKNKQIKYYEK